MLKYSCFQKEEKVQKNLAAAAACSRGNMVVLDDIISWLIVSHFQKKPLDF